MHWWFQITLRDDSIRIYIYICWQCSVNSICKVNKLLTVLWSWTSLEDCFCRAALIMAGPNLFLVSCALTATESTIWSRQEFNRRLPLGISERQCDIDVVSSAYFKFCNSLLTSWHGCWIGRREKNLTVLASNLGECSSINVWGSSWLCCSRITECRWRFCKSLSEENVRWIRCSDFSSYFSSCVEDWLLYAMLLGMKPLG